MNSSAFDLLSQQFPALTFSQEETLAPHTYMKVGGPAEVFALIKERADLESVVIFARKNNIPLTVLGGASNVLVADEGIRGLVIKNLTRGISTKKNPDGSGTIEADSGVITNLLVREAVNNELQGLERLLGVPGSVGGAVFNNSHFSHNDLIGNFVKNVHIIDKNGEPQTLPQAEMKFAYDYSILQETGGIIIWIEFAFPHGNKEELEAVVVEVTRKRASTQPLGQASSGCMFQNATMPDGTKKSAGYLIDQSGLKGTKVGKAMVSDIHANFIVNTGGATQEEVEQLAQIVERTVKEKFGVELHREVFRIGGK